MYERVWIGLINGCDSFGGPLLQFDACERTYLISYYVFVFLIARASRFDYFPVFFKN